MQLRAKIMEQLKEVRELVAQVDDEVEALDDAFGKTYDLYDNEVAISERNNRVLTR